MTHSSNQNHISNQTQDENRTSSYDSSISNQKNQKSRFSPTVKGALIGAVAGSVLPIFGTISGAVIGGISGKIYEKRCARVTS